MSKIAHMQECDKEGCTNPTIVSANDESYHHPIGVHLCLHHLRQDIDTSLERCND
jgi:hypothetical protein